MTENITQGKREHFHVGKTTQILMEIFQISISFEEAKHLFMEVFWGCQLHSLWEAAGLRGKKHQKPHSAMSAGSTKS